MKNKFEALTAFQSWPEDWQRFCAEYWTENDKPKNQKMQAVAVDGPSTSPAKPCKRKKASSARRWTAKELEWLVYCTDQADTQAAGIRDFLQRYKDRNFGACVGSCGMGRGILKERQQIMSYDLTSPHWQVKQGPLVAYVFADTPAEARREANKHWGPALVQTMKLKVNVRPITVRLLSGFPEIPGHELVFGETVLKGDCLPEADSPAYRVINCDDDLEIYLLDVPSHAVFIPPFRAHTTQAGRWKSPTLDECRKRASGAILEFVEAGRKKGFSCE